MIGCLVSVLVSVSAFAGSSKECQELKTEQIRLAFVGSNLANLDTIRTPEGGRNRPYRVKSCSNGVCEAKRDDRAPIMKYLPGHLEANDNGDFAVPNIDFQYDSFETKTSRGKRCLRREDFNGVSNISNF